MTTYLLQRLGALICLLSMVISPSSRAETERPIRVGSKIFTESFVLAEIIAQTIEDAGEVKVERRFGLGATGIVFESLKTGDIDIYPEYTGTIAEIFLKDQSLKTEAALNSKLQTLGLQADTPFGFNNTYALAIGREQALKLGIRTISDLLVHQDIRAGFTHEFLKRQDGLEALSRHYGLQLHNVVGMEHSLLYQSLADGKIDLVEVYSTDAKVAKYDLVVLEDDRHFFPNYKAVLFYRPSSLSRYPRTLQALKKLANSISGAQMIKLNAKVELDRASFAQAAAFQLDKAVEKKTFSLEAIGQRTVEHLFLVFVSLLLAIVVGLPLGYWATRTRWWGSALIAGIGILQTIPSLALLCFLVPVFGIGYLPAVIALFLYALLPIVRNTFLGFHQIDPRLIESARTLALEPWQMFRRVELPLASPSILAGIKISAVINVGTATLAAFIGAGGYGALVVTGLTLNDTNLILQGAIPSAILALLIHGLSEWLSKKLIPRGLQENA